MQLLMVGEQWGRNKSVAREFSREFKIEHWDGSVVQSARWNSLKGIESAHSVQAEEPMVTPADKVNTGRAVLHLHQTCILVESESQIVCGRRRR